MILNKKAQGLPIQTIIIFGILIIVAIIVMVFFAGKFGFLSKTVGTCISQNGECVYDKSGKGVSTCTDKPVKIITQDCYTSDSKKNNEKDYEGGGPCCIALG